MVFRILVVFSCLLVTLGCSVSAPLVGSQGLKVVEARARAGDVESQYQLGMQYTLNGQYAWDRFRGYLWFAEAATKDHADAQYMVGIAKLLGRGTLTDVAGAVHSFILAAGQGQARAQYQLGLAYLNGTGVSKNKSWGRQWLEQAAWNDHRDAQFVLGALFAKGVGGQANLAEAWRWLVKSRPGDPERAEKALSPLQKTLSTQDKMTGEKLLGQQPETDMDGLYANPRLRYLQVMLNRLGYPAGSEDGLSGPLTDATIAAYVQKNALPRETQPLQLIEFLRGNYQEN